jgi:regulator of replication initiation timing
MTKRFKFHCNDEYNAPMIYDFETEQWYFCIDLNKITDVLNEQHETIQQLETCFDVCANEKRALEIENEQLKKSIDYHLNVCKSEKKKISDMYGWGTQRQGKTVSSQLMLKYIGAIEVLEQIKKELEL